MKVKDLVKKIDSGLKGMKSSDRQRLAENLRTLRSQNRFASEVRRRVEQG